MRRLLVLALLFAGHAPVLSPARTLKGQTPPAKSSKPPQKQTELEKLIAERDRLMKERKYREALPIAQRVVEILREEKSPSLQIAAAQYQLGSTQYSLDDLAAADKSWSEALVLRKAKAPRTAILADTHQAVGVVAFDLHDYQRALTEFKNALEIRQHLSPNSLFVATIYYNLGNCAVQLSRLDDAQTYYNSALSIRRSINKHSTAVAETLAQLASVARIRQDYRTAQALYQEAILIYRSVDPKSREIITIHMKLGDVAAESGNYAQSRSHHERALALMKNDRGSQRDVVIAMNDMGSIAFQFRNYTTAKKDFSQALSIANHIPLEPRLLATLERNMGSVYLMLEDFVSSKKRYEKALSIIQQAGLDASISAVLYGDLGDVELALQEYAAAIACHERSLAIRIQATTSDSPQVASSLSSLAEVYYTIGDHSQSRKIMEQCLSIRRKHVPNTSYLAVTLNNIASIVDAQGDLLSAQSYAEEARVLHEALGITDSRLAISLHTLGNIAYRRADYDLASHYHQRSLTIRNQHTSDSIEPAYSHNALGIVSYAKQDYTLARRYFEDSLELCHRYSYRSTVHADTLLYLGSTLRELQYFNSAEIVLQSALDIFSHINEKSPAVAEVLFHLASLDFRRNRISRAMSRLNQALELIGDQEMGNRLPDYLSLRGEIAASKGEQEALKDCLAHQIDIAHRRILGQRLLTSYETCNLEADISKNVTRLGWLEDPSDFYPWLPTLRAAGLTLQTRAKISELAAEADENVRRARSAVQIATKQETDWATNPRPKELDDKAWNDKLLELRSARQSAELKLATLLKEKDPRLADDLKVNLEDVQRNLAKDAALVEYLRVSTWDDKAKKVGQDAYGAFIVNRQGPVKFVRLGDAEEIDKLVADFMARVNADSSADRAQPVGPAPKPTEGKSREELGKELFRKLIAPLGKLPANLQIAPDSSLHGLAFDALQDVRGRFLLELKSLSLVGSGRDLAVRPPTAPAGPAVVFGVGAFQADLAAREQPVAAKTEPSAAATRGQRGGSVWGSLPGAVEEAREVASRLGVEPILDSQAIEERLIGVKNPSVLHLATHGFSFPPAFEAPKRDRMEGLSLGERFGSADNPMLRSGIVMSGANDEEKLRAAGYLDGWVTALDLSLMDLRGTELVVLSACDTGLGDVRQSEGVFGLQRALRFAGAQTLVMSLFEVPDASTASLMKDFYGAWKPGSAPGTKQSALRAAKLKLLKDPKTRSPKNWAGFVLLGDR